MKENMFDLFHKYNKLVRRELADAIVCSCGEKYTSTIDPKNDDNVMLVCYGCGTETYPGEFTLRKMRTAVRGYF